MKNIITIIKFTIYELLHKKAFWITNIFIFVLILLGTNITNIISLFEDDETSKVLLVDSLNIYENNLSYINEYGFDYEYVVENNSYTEEHLFEVIENETYEFVIVINSSENKIEYKVISEDSYYGELETTISVMESMYNDLMFKKLDLTEEELLSLYLTYESDYIYVKENEVMNYSNYMVAMFLTIILFYAVYFYAMQVSFSVTTEKTSKIVEILLTSSDAKSIIIGKTLGIGIIGIIQIIVFTIIGLICANLFIPGEILSDILSGINLSPMLFFVILIYFIFGYLLYSFLFALTGSMVSRAEDTQSANAPVSIILVLSFYLAFFSMADSSNLINTIAKLLPFSSPFLIPVSFINGTSSMLEVIISMVILIITVYVTSYISIKIYKNAILNFGSKINLKSLITIFREKN